MLTNLSFNPVDIEKLTKDFKERNEELKKNGQPFDFDFEVFQTVMKNEIKKPLKKKIDKKGLESIKNSFKINNLMVSCCENENNKSYSVEDAHKLHNMLNDFTFSIPVVNEGELFSSSIEFGRKEVQAEINFNQVEFKVRELVEIVLKKNQKVEISIKKSPSKLVLYFETMSFSSSVTREIKSFFESRSITYSNQNEKQFVIAKGGELSLHIFVNKHGSRGVKIFDTFRACRHLFEHAKHNHFSKIQNMLEVAKNKELSLLVDLEIILLSLVNENANDESVSKLMNLVDDGIDAFNGDDELIIQIWSSVDRTIDKLPRKKDESFVYLNQLQEMKQRLIAKIKHPDKIVHLSGLIEESLLNRVHLDSSYNSKYIIYEPMDIDSIKSSTLEEKIHVLERKWKNKEIKKPSRLSTVERLGLIGKLILNEDTTQDVIQMFAKAMNELEFSKDIPTDISLLFKFLTQYQRKNIEYPLGVIYDDFIRVFKEYSNRLNPKEIVRLFNLGYHQFCYNKTNHLLGEALATIAIYGSCLTDGTVDVINHINIKDIDDPEWNKQFFEYLFLIESNASNGKDFLKVGLKHLERLISKSSEENGQIPDSYLTLYLTFIGSEFVKKNFDKMCSIARIFLDKDSKKFYKKFIEKIKELKKIQAAGYLSFIYDLLNTREGVYDFFAIKDLILNLQNLSTKTAFSELIVDKSWGLAEVLRSKNPNVIETDVFNYVEALYYLDIIKKICASVLLHEKKSYFHCISKVKSTYYFLKNMQSFESDMLPTLVDLYYNLLFVLKTNYQDKKDADTITYLRNSLKDLKNWCHDSEVVDKDRELEIDLSIQQMEKLLAKLKN